MSVRRFFSRPSGVALLSIGLVRTVAGRPQPLGGETIFFHQVVLDLVCARVGELNVVSASTGRVGVAIDIDDRVLIGTHSAGEFIHDGARIEAHAGRIGIEVDGPVLRRNGRCSLGGFFVFDRRFAGCHGKAVGQFLDVAAIQAFFRIERVFNDPQLAIHVLSHAKDVVIVGVRSGGAHERTVVGVIRKLHAAEHGLRQVGWNIEILDRPDQVVRPLRL